VIFGIPIGALIAAAAVAATLTALVVGVAIETVNQKETSC
jgi:hypothetical protein